MSLTMMKPITMTKKGQPKKYSTTTTVDEKDTLENIVLHLQSVPTKYLILRFFG